MHTTYVYTYLCGKLIYRNEPEVPEPRAEKWHL